MAGQLVECYQFSFHFSTSKELPPEEVSCYMYTANVLTIIKTTGVPAGKICTIYGKWLKELRGNPVIIIGSVIIMGFPSPHTFHGVKIRGVQN